ncbi:MAG: hypothetical protein U0X76_13385 [Bacteroidia bacterium]
MSRYFLKMANISGKHKRITGPADTAPPKINEPPIAVSVISKDPICTPAVS